MRKTLSLIVLLACLTPLQAQWEEDVQELTHKERTFFGASAGLAISQFETYIMLAPSVSYRLTNNILAGVGVKYIYSQFNFAGVSSKNSIYGGSLFAQHNIFSPKFFVHGELESLNGEVRERFTNTFSRRWVTMGFVGAGYRNFYSERSFYQIMVLYDLIDDPYSPYPYMWGLPITLRFGIVF